MVHFILPPFDLHCPSVAPSISKRCCSVCGIYHASIKSATAHTKECHSKTAPPTSITPQADQRIRPIRIAARRQREMMVVLRDHLNGESAEWLDDEEIDADQHEHDSSAQGSAVPIIDNIQQWTDTPWENLA